MTALYWWHTTLDPLLVNWFVVRLNGLEFVSSVQQAP
jgi:hypothetical protein